jgi:hypothetical protein
MLVHDRYLEPCSTGLLWNSNDGPTMHAVTRSHGELAALLMHRNRLAASLTGIVRNPPPMLDSEHTCSTCFMAPACALYHKVSQGAAISWMHTTKYDVIATLGSPILCPFLFWVGCWFVHHALAIHLGAAMHDVLGLMPSSHSSSLQWQLSAATLLTRLVPSQAVEGGGCESSGMSPAQWHALTSHLSSNHTSFFSHWTALVDAEESGAREGRRQLWALSGAEREVTEGACVAGLKLVVSEWMRE